MPLYRELQGNTDKSHAVQWLSTLTAAELDLFDRRDWLNEMAREDLVYMWEIQDKDGAWIDLGCCSLRETGERRVANQYNQHFGDAGLAATDSIASRVRSEYAPLVPDTDAEEEPDYVENDKITLPGLANDYTDWSSIFPADASYPPHEYDDSTAIHAAYGLDGVAHISRIDVYTGSSTGMCAGWKLTYDTNPETVHEHHYDTSTVSVTSDYLLMAPNEFVNSFTIYSETAKVSTQPEVPAIIFGTNKDKTITCGTPSTSH